MSSNILLEEEQAKFGETEMAKGVTMAIKVAPLGYLRSPWNINSEESVFFAIQFAKKLMFYSLAL